MSSLKRFAVSSNLAYLLPLAAAAYTGLWGLAVALGVLFVTSTGYHLSEEKSFVVADQIAAYVVIALNIIVLVITKFPLGNVSVALVLLAAAGYFRYIGEKKSFDLHHGLWHVSCALITLACISAYALPF
ncbi:hypothetical protein K8R03_03815 [Candidatus Kaiserbacteria bacterium]|nr:hypothetical protein [Candidatus Kaiserbacteria bacterium]